MKPGLEQMQKQVEKISIGEISKVVSEDNCIAAYVPVTMIHRIDDIRLHDRTYYIACSEDEGKTWKFVSSQGKPEQETFFKSIYPKLTTQIPFPKCKKEFIK